MLAGSGLQSLRARLCHHCDGQVVYAIHVTRSHTAVDKIQTADAGIVRTEIKLGILPAVQ